VVVGKQREPFYEELGRQIAYLRQKRGISQAALGALMRPQMTRASIANIETGKQRVLAHTFVQLAGALACDLETLAGDRENKPAQSNDVQRELEEKLKKNKIPKSIVDELTRSLGLALARKER
jgi:transcriptional regulator with XRE-family HTH domain